MKSKTKRAGREIAVIVLLTMALLCVTAMPVSATEVEFTIYTMASTGQEKVVNLYPWPQEHAYVFYYPHEQGSRTFTAWHQDIFEPEAAGTVEFYWKDTAVPNDPWHHWATKPIHCYWPRYKTTLYSGSNTIAYKFSVAHHSSTPIDIHIMVK